MSVSHESIDKLFLSIEDKLHFIRREYSSIYSIRTMLICVSSLVIGSIFIANKFYIFIGMFIFIIGLIFFSYLVRYFLFLHFTNIIGANNFILYNKNNTKKNIGTINEIIEKIYSIVKYFPVIKPPEIIHNFIPLELIRDELLFLTLRMIELRGELGEKMA